MAPGVLGIGTTAYMSAHNQVNHTQVATLGVYSKLLLDSRPCKGLPHLSKRFQPGPRWQVSFKNSENFSNLSFRVGVTLNIHWAEPEDPSDPTHVEVIQVVLVFDF